MGEEVPACAAAAGPREDTVVLPGRCQGEDRLGNAGPGAHLCFWVIQTREGMPWATDPVSRKAVGATSPTGRNYPVIHPGVRRGPPGTDPSPATEVVCNLNKPLSTWTFFLFASEKVMVRAILHFPMAPLSSKLLLVYV